MIRNRILVGLVAGITLLTGCATGAANPAQTGTAGVPADSSAPATSQAPAPAKELSIDEFMSQLAAAQAGVKTYTMDMTMETAMMGNAAEMTMKGAVDQTDPSDVDMKMDMELGGMEMKLLKVDGDMYMQMAATGKKWMKVPKSQMDQYEDTTESADLTAGLEKAKAAMKEIALVGEEAVEGTNTRHYRITMDAAGLAEMTGSDARIAGDTFDYDIWLDDANLVRKVAMEVEAEADGKDLPMKIAGVMGNYNEPVDIKAPNKPDVTELPG